MKGQEEIRRGYLVRIRQVPGRAGVYHVFYVPRGLQQARGPGRTSKRAPEFKARVQIRDDEILVHWEKPPSDAEVTQEDFEQDARRRVKLLHEWLGQLSPLIDRVENWARELGWVSRRIEKPMEDSEIGDYRAPGLLLQKDLTRVALDPIGRSAPGADGVVDLYLLPAYDDIASLYFYDGGWHLHYLAPGKAAVATVREGESKPVTRASLRKVLEEMTKNAQ